MSIGIQCSLRGSYIFNKNLKKNKIRTEKKMKTAFAIKNKPYT